MLISSFAISCLFNWKKFNRIPGYLTKLIIVIINGEKNIFNYQNIVAHQSEVDQDTVSLDLGSPKLISIIYMFTLFLSRWCILIDSILKFLKTILHKILKVLYTGNFNYIYLFAHYHFCISNA